SLPRRTRWPLITFAGVSLAVHAVVAPFVLWAVLTSARANSKMVPAVLPAPAVSIDVSLIEPTVLNPYATAQSPTEQAKEAELKVLEAKKPEERTDLHGQVVDTAEPKVEIRPEDSKYLAKYDSKVEHETKAPPGRGEGAGGRQRVAVISRPPQP